MVAVVAVVVVAPAAAALVAVAVVDVGGVVVVGGGDGGGDDHGGMLLFLLSLATPFLREQRHRVGGRLHAARVKGLLARVWEQVDVPCATLVEWVGCAAQLPGSSGSGQQVGDVCTAECAQDNELRCAPGTEPVPANATANTSAWCRDCPAGRQERRRPGLRVVVRHLYSPSGHSWLAVLGW